MKWILLMIFTFISGQAFSCVEFEKVHQLSYDTKIEETLVIMKPFKQKKLVAIHPDIRFLSGRTIAAKK